jgi:predicted ATPase
MMLLAGSSCQDEARPPLLVGRAREQRLLSGHLAASMAGRGRLVLLGGSAGIGKTTLVAELAREAMGHRIFVLRGACYDLTTTPPYGPWRDLAAGYRAEAGLPPLPRVLTDDDNVTAGGQVALFGEVRDFLAALAAVSPLLVVLEDLHWADHASLDLIRVVGRFVPAAPLLVVGTYRADEVARDNPLYQVLPALVREVQAERLDLQRLDDDGVRALIAAHCPLPETDATRMTRYLQAHAEGNPFFALELLRTFEAEGVLRPQGEGWVVGELRNVGVPPLLRQVIDGRVARLGAENRDLLAVAAVIGQEVPLGLWSAICELAEEDLLPTVDLAIEANLLESRADGVSVRFAHALVREALYEGILPMRRRAWHRRIGDVLAAQPGSDQDVVAHHFVQAGDDRAVLWRAGDREPFPQVLADP